MNAKPFLFLALSTFALACSKDETASTPAPTLTMTVSPTTLAQNGTFHVSLKTTNFTIREPSAAEEAAFEAGTAPINPSEGHFHLYVDSTDSTPLDMDGTELEKDEVLPCALDAAIDPGKHVLIARLHTLDHKILLPEVKATADITVTKGDCSASGSGGAGGAGGAGGGHSH